MMTTEGSTKIVNFMTPGAGVMMLGRGHISHCQYVVFSTLSIYSTLITIVLMDYDAVFLYHCWFSFFLWWGCWYTNINPSDKKVSVKSLILRLLFRPVGLLLNFVNVFSLFRNYLHLEKDGALNLNNLNLLNPRLLVPSYVETSQVVLEKIFKSCHCIFAIS